MVGATSSETILYVSVISVYNTFRYKILMEFFLLFIADSTQTSMEWRKIPVHRYGTTADGVMGYYPIGPHQTTSNPIWPHVNSCAAQKTS